MPTLAQIIRNSYLHSKINTSLSAETQRPDININGQGDSQSQIFDSGGIQRSFRLGDGALECRVHKIGGSLGRNGGDMSQNGGTAGGNGGDVSGIGGTAGGNGGDMSQNGGTAGGNGGDVSQNEGTAGGNGGNVSGIGGTVGGNGGDVSQNGGTAGGNGSMFKNIVEIEGRNALDVTGNGSNIDENSENGRWFVNTGGNDSTFDHISENADRNISTVGKIYGNGVKIQNTSDFRTYSDSLGRKSGYVEYRRKVGSDQVNDENIKTQFESEQGILNARESKLGDLNTEKSYLRNLNAAESDLGNLNAEKGDIRNFNSRIRSSFEDSNAKRSEFRYMNAEKSYHRNFNVSTERDIRYLKFRTNGDQGILNARTENDQGVFEVRESDHGNLKARISDQGIFKGRENNLENLNARESDQGIFKVRKSDKDLSARLGSDFIDFNSRVRDQNFNTRIESNLGSLNSRGDNLVDFNRASENFNTKIGTLRNLTDNSSSGSNFGSTLSNLSNHDLNSELVSEISDLNTGTLGDLNVKIGTTFGDVEKISTDLSDFNSNMGADFYNLSANNSAPLGLNLGPRSNLVGSNLIPGNSSGASIIPGSDFGGMNVGPAINSGTSTLPGSDFGGSTLPDHDLGGLKIRQGNYFEGLKFGSGSEMSNFNFDSSDIVFECNDYIDIETEASCWVQSLSDCLGPSSQGPLNQTKLLNDNLNTSQIPYTYGTQDLGCLSCVHQNVTTSWPLRLDASEGVLQNLITQGRELICSLGTCSSPLCDNLLGSTAAPIVHTIANTSLPILPIPQLSTSSPLLPLYISECKVQHSLHLPEIVQNSSQDAAMNSTEEGDVSEIYEYDFSFLFLMMFILAGGIGNILVCLAICLERRLHNVTNYFLMSLAVADLLVSLVVMPFGAIAGFLGYWPFGLVWCNIYVSCDVLACTSSIMHMCTISLGRYLGIRNPLKTRSTSKKTVAVKVVLVWLLAMVVTSIITVLGIIDTSNIMPAPHICTINNQTFFIFGSLCAFYIPMLIMVISYGLTVHLLRRKAKFALDTPGKSRTIGRYRSVQRKPEIVIDTPGKSRTIDRYRTGRRNPPVSYTFPFRNYSNGHTFEFSNKCEQGTQTPESIARETRNFKLKALRLQLVGSASWHLRFLPRKKSTPPLNSVANEQKASKVLGIVFFAFVCCWTPFFILNIYFAACPACYVSDHLVNVCLWLGYVSSTINPIIYTIFNRTFKAAFIKILKCDYNFDQRHIRSHSMSDNNTPGTCGVGAAPVMATSCSIRTLSTYVRSPNYPHNLTSPDEQLEQEEEHQC